jgi:membrane protease YdiL (CAAX protease family)
MGMVLVFASVFSFAGIFVSKIIFGVDMMQLYDLMQNAKTDANSRNALLVFQAIAGSIGTFLVPALLFPKAIGKFAPTYIKITQPFKAYYLLFAPLLIIISMPMISWINELNQAIKFPASMADFELSIRNMEDQAKKLTEILVITNSPAQFFMNLIVVAMLPAIAEEFFFRGVVQNFARQCFYNPHVAIWFTAIVFSGIHGQFYGFIPRVVLGALLGYLYLYSGNIWVVVLAHFMNNGLALLGFVLSDVYKDVAFFSEDYHFPLYMSIVSIVATVGLILWMSKLQFRSLQQQIFE